jgi:hypothetical protein
MSEYQHDKDHLRRRQVRLHRTIQTPALSHAKPRLRPILVASGRQVDTPTAVGVDGRIAKLNAHALLPVAGRW